MPGTQFTIFDVDYAPNDFADKMTITGSYNGSSVTPTLTNGITNYVFGNVAIGDVTASDTTSQGTVVATFASPVDTITIVYGNHTTAPADPDGQAIAINDFTFCNPQTTLSVTKLSSVVSDGVSGTNPKVRSRRHCPLLRARVQFGQRHQQQRRCHRQHSGQSDVRSGQHALRYILRGSDHGRG